MRLHSYVVARDYGFAPNPFHGVCTLATCKPEIRRTAAVGDWIAGTGSASNSLQGHLIYAMKVDEIIDFNTYWHDPRFASKKPDLHTSKKYAFGDNIYHQEADGTWCQRKSHHTGPGGAPNAGNIRNDTGSTQNVLLGRRFVYYGEAAPKIPQALRHFEGHDLCAGRGHKNRFPAAMIEHFIAWLDGRDDWGRFGRPVDWKRSP